MSTFNTDWKFHLGGLEDAWQKGFDDREWRVVTLPHDWSIESPFDRRHSSGTGYLPGGTAFYRKHFVLPEDAKGGYITLTFDGVYKNAQVWVNGYYLGNRPNGYTTFSFDISAFCLFGGANNVIAVKVSHEDIADSRWFTGSGIYRKVTLSVKNREHIREYGVFITTEKADEKQATVHADISVDADAGCEVCCQLYAVDGTLVASQQTAIGTGASVSPSADVSLALTIENPCLWSDESPYLYEAVVVLRRGTHVLDSTSIKVGIRTFHFDSETGFTLNGVPRKLRGICVHHDAGCLGAAVPAKVWRARLQSLKRIGANALRTSHNPPMPELLDLCDEMGFLVIDEAFDEWEGCKNKWSTGHNVYPPKHFGYSEHFPQWHEFDLKTMVLRDRNHPSVFMWSIGNEIDYPNDPYGHPAFQLYVGNNDANKPKNELKYNPDKPNAERLPVVARKLVDIVKQSDITRPVSAAVACPELSNLTGYSECFDVIGYNYKEALYDEIHSAHPEWIIFGSENGHGYDQWLAVRDNPFIAGQFLWTGIDFLGETKGWPSHGSQAGLLDLAGFMKPLAHYRQSMWSGTAVAKLFARETGEWRDSWNFPDDATVEVICYTNGSQAELFINDISLGRETATCHIIKWQVPYQSGELHVVTDNQASDKLVTVSAPVAIRLDTDDRELSADGQDIAILNAFITDASGHVADDAVHRIHVEVTGGVLLGIENGDLSDTQEYAADSRHAYNGRLTIYVRTDTQAGVMGVRVSSPKLRGAYMEIQKQGTGF